MADKIEIKPYDSSGVPKPNNIYNLNYTNQDFWSMKTRLVNLIRERFGSNGTVLPNTFNDFVESSIAIMLIENCAFLADTLSFKIDQLANEVFIDTVTEIENAFRLAKLVGFLPQNPIASRSMWIATINNTLTTDLTIPTPFLVDTANGTPITIELFQADSENNPIFNSDIIIPAGTTSNASIVGLEGKTYTDEFDANGLSGQSFLLTNSPVIFGSVMVFVDGMQWTPVDYFTDSQPRKEFRIEFDSTYSGYVVFGNNRAGIIPSQGSKITVVYRVGGGIIGNIVTGFVETQTQVSVPGLGFAVPVEFRNYTKGEYGYDGDTIEDIRRKLPAWIKTQDRAVTGDDYKTLADQFSTPYHGKIGKSTAVLRNYGCAGNVVDLYVLAQDGANELTEASNELKVDLQQEINEKKMITDFVCIRNGTIITADVSIDITLNRIYRKFEAEYKTTIQQKLDMFFSLNNWDYGKNLKDTDLVKELSDIKQISNFDITFITIDPNNSGQLITAKYYEIIRPGNVYLSFVYN